MAKIASGQFTLNERYVSIGELIENSLPLVRQRADDIGVVFRTSVAAGLPLVWVDETRVRQILINLLSNAVKFTRNGGTVSVEANLYEDGSLALVVADTGIGMTQEQVRIAMQPFRQVDSSLAREYEGTGLGLPLTEGLMQLHGGHMKIASTPGAGTVVTAIFPAERVSSEVVERIRA